MAFIFNPNPSEGDRQTNDETGVEYIFTDGAWRPLGPKIEDEFDTLDERYIKNTNTTLLGEYYRLRGPNVEGTGVSTFQVIDEGEQKLYNIKTPGSDNEGWVANVEYVNNTVADYLPLTGGTITGELYIDISANGVHDLGFAPRDADNTSVIYSMNGGICRLRSLAGNNIDSVDVRTHFGWGRNADGDPETVLYHLNDPIEAHHAVNLQYLESYVADELEDIDLSDYLPLTGGTLTGNLRMTGAGFYTDAIIKTTRNSGNAFQVKPDDGAETAFIKTDGKSQFTKLTINSDDVGKIDLRGDGNCDIRRNGNYIVSLQEDKIGVSKNVNLNNHQINNLADPTDGSDAATKDYVDNNTSSDSMNINGNNVVTTSWKILGSGRTFIANSSNELGLYNLKAPSSSHHAARKQDLDDKVPGSFTFENGALYYNT